MSRNRALLFAIAGSSLLSGCADYLNNYDTVSLAAGDAQKHNMLLHTVDPFNPQSENTAIETDGVRAVDAMKTYQDSLKPGQPQQGPVTVNIGTPTQ
jgi:hypothetical protein